MRSSLFPRLGLLIILSVIWVPTQSLKAMSGSPFSGTFALGARLDPEGKHIRDATTIAADQGIDWIAMDFDWKRVWLSSDEQPNWVSLDKAMNFARENQLAVMISITNPPQWVLTNKGPDPSQTVKLILDLTRRYPDALQAIEIFPGPNTINGWGATPNPSAYRDLLKAVHLAMIDERSRVHIVSGGLIPLMPDAHLKDMDDLTYLKKLYSVGAARYMPILGLRLLVHQGNPYAPPEGTKFPVLRHYEIIRQIMLNSGHRDGLIWITSFSWPFVDTTSKTILNNSIRDQANWLIQTFSLFRKQLYLGAAFFYPLNPPNNVQSEGEALPTLVMADKSLHPAFELLGKNLPEEKNGQSQMLSTGRLKKITGKSIKKLPLPKG